MPTERGEDAEGQRKKNRIQGRRLIRVHYRADEIPGHDAKRTRRTVGTIPASDIRKVETARTHNKGTYRGYRNIEH